jgi:magnesium chelatase subunit D
VRRDDFRVAVRKPRTRATAVFAVDASGSSAFNRLAEAKGAIECCLAECYVRRDRVALLAFRGREASLLLEPTRSLARPSAASPPCRAAGRRPWPPGSRRPRASPTACAAGATRRRW